jgi:hypothetical protein
MFSVDSLALFPSVLSDQTEVAETVDEEAPIASLPLHQLIIVPIGVHSPRPHLLVRPPISFSFDAFVVNFCSPSSTQLLTSTGHLIIYEANRIFPSSDPLPESRSSLAVRFVKIVSRAVRPPDDPDDMDFFIPWSIVPFTGLRGLTGAFLTGDLPFWILRDETGPVTLFGVDERMVHAFSQTTSYGQEDQYILTTDDVSLCIAEEVDESPPLMLRTSYRLRDPTSSLSLVTSRSTSPFLIAGRQRDGPTPTSCSTCRQSISSLSDCTRRRSRSSTRMTTESSTKAVRLLPSSLLLLSRLTCILLFHQTIRYCCRFKRGLRLSC